MFGSNQDNKNKNAAAASAPPSGGHSLNSIVQGSTVEGTINANSDLRVDGVIKGKLICDAKVIIGPTGAVEGEIRCQNAVVEGKFEGTLYVHELLNVRETATINGEVTTGKLIVQPGGVFNVTCKMGQNSATSGAAAAGLNTAKTGSNATATKVAG